MSPRQAAIPRGDVKLAVQALAVMAETWAGQRGNPLDRAVTFRDLVDVGAVELRDPSRGVSRPGDIVSTLLPDLTTPPAIAGLTAKGALASIILTWNDPGKLYSNHSYVEVFRADADNLGQAVLVGTARGAVYTDMVGAGATYYYWVRAVSTAGVKGPFNSPQGTKGQTGKDPAYVLDILAGEIRETHLYQSLSERIDLVDGSGPDSVNERLDLVWTAVAGNTAAVEVTASSVAGLEAQYTIKVDVNGHVAGIGLAARPAGSGGITSEILLRADKVAIVMPGRDGLIPFVVGEVNGEVVVAMDGATIVDASIQDAAIGNLAADKLFAVSGTIADAVIGDADITNAMIGDVIRSDNYQAGQSGWIIHKSGYAEFDAVSIRGQLVADQIKAKVLTADHIVNESLDKALMAEGSGVVQDVRHGSREVYLPGGCTEYVVLVSGQAKGQSLGESDPSGIIKLKKANGSVVKSWNVTTDWPFFWMGSVSYTSRLELDVTVVSGSVSISESYITVICMK